MLGEWVFLDAISIFIANYMILINRGFINKSLDALCKIVSNSFYQGQENRVLETQNLESSDNWSSASGRPLYFMRNIYWEDKSPSTFTQIFKIKDVWQTQRVFLAFLNKQIYVLKIHVLKNKCWAIATHPLLVSVDIQWRKYMYVEPHGLWPMY